MKAVECTVVHSNDSNLFYLFKLVEENVLINEPVDGWWLTLIEELSLIDFVAVLAIVIAGYDEAKQGALKDEVYKIKPMPHESSSNSKFLFKLLKGVILEPELYLKMVHDKFGDLPLAKLEALAEPPLKSKQGHVAVNGREYRGTASAGC